MMKKKLMPLAGALFLALALPALAANKAGKEVTITGQGTCAKCGLKEASSCQNVVQVERKGKKRTYYLVQNDLSKKFHDNLCKAPHKVTVTGTVKRVEGKLELTATKIDLAN